MKPVTGCLKRQHRERKTFFSSVFNAKSDTAQTLRNPLCLAIFQAWHGTALLAASQSPV